MKEINSFSVPPLAGSRPAWENGRMGNHATVFLCTYIYNFTMIVLCPFCGRSLSKTLEDGISSCDNCLRVFDTSSFYKILSASWVARRWNWEAEAIQAKFDLTNEEISLVCEHVIEKLLPHDEFVKILEDRK